MNESALLTVQFYKRPKLPKAYYIQVTYYIHQGNKSDKERKIVIKKLSYMHTKRFNIFF
jgi:hypothetical protein